MPLELSEVSANCQPAVRSGGHPPVVDPIRSGSNVMAPSPVESARSKPCLPHEAYYACTGRQKYGPNACMGERLPREKAERAVLHQLASVYRDERLVGEALAKARAEAEQHCPELEQRLASISAEITRAERAFERYHEAFEQGKLSPERCETRLSRLQARLDDLHAQHAGLSLQAPHEAAQAPTAADLAA